jgi:Asp-tRNA(Asn)/Glu-tRNA(Gln) amidotransferase A subunit family amidase
MGDRAFASATELSNEIRDRHIGCVELLDFYLARAERHNPALKRSLSGGSTRRENAPAPPMPPLRAASVGDRCTAFR